MKKCNRNCTVCPESDVFGNCFEKCVGCEYDWTPDCFFGQWCKYWDGHGMPEIPKELKKSTSAFADFDFLNDDLPF